MQWAGDCPSIKSTECLSEFGLRSGRPLVPPARPFLALVAIADELTPRRGCEFDHSDRWPYPAGSALLRAMSASSRRVQAYRVILSAILTRKG